jgi:hypothetical protein
MRRAGKLARAHGQARDVSARQKAEKRQAGSLGFHEEALHLLSNSVRVLARSGVWSVTRIPGRKIQELTIAEVEEVLLRSPRSPLKNIDDQYRRPRPPP